MKYQIGDVVQIGTFNDCILDGFRHTENLIPEGYVWLPILALNSLSQEYCVAVTEKDLPAWEVEKDDDRPKHWNNVWQGDLGPEEENIGQRAWIIKESVIKTGKTVVNPEIIYGGKCRICTDYNPYAACDENSEFTCYRCRK